MLISFHMKILKHFLNIVSLIHTQCSSLAVADDLNVKNFLCLLQVLNFEDCSKKLLKSYYSWDCCEDYNNVINIKKQYDVFLTMKQETWVSITLMKLNLDKFSNTSFMLVFYDLFEFIQTSHYVQCTVWCNFNVWRWCHVDDFLEKRLSECIVHIHLMTFQVLKCN